MSEEDADERKKEMARLTSPEYRMIELVEKLNERVESNAEESRQRAKETQRNIDFIIQQQAQFVTDIQKLSEKQDATREIVERLATVTLSRFERVNGDLSNLENKMAALVDSHIKLADAQKNTDERLNALTDSHIRLADAQKITDEKMSALLDSHIKLADSQKRTDERLSALADSQKKTDERMGALADSQKKADERLNAFIATVERLINEGRNGK